MKPDMSSPVMAGRIAVPVRMQRDEAGRVFSVMAGRIAVPIRMRGDETGRVFSVMAGRVPATHAPADVQRQRQPADRRRIAGTRLDTPGHDGEDVFRLIQGITG